MVKFYSISCCFLFSLLAFSQEENNTEKKTDDFHHRITIAMANVHIPVADNMEQQGAFYIVPTWVVNYDYWFRNKFAIGLHNDIALQQYEVSFEENVITRNHPIVITVVGLYKVSPHWTFLLGAGREFEKNENFNLLRLGTEYGIEIQNNFEINFNFIYDSKFNAYDAFMFGFGLSKKL